MPHHRKGRKEREVLAEGGAENHKAIEKYGILKTEPQMNADERGLIALLSENQNKITISYWHHPPTRFRYIFKCAGVLK
jgi:hypothetical protein